MAYTIHQADGTAITIADNVIDTNFYNVAGGSTGSGQGTQLVGRNTVDYGAAIAQNFLQLTENFASSAGTQPISTVVTQGQLWFNKTEGALYVRVTPPAAGSGMDNWQKCVTSGAGGSVPTVNPTGTPADGDISIVGSVISIYANGAYRQIFPAIYS